MPHPPPYGSYNPPVQAHNLVPQANSDRSDRIATGLAQPFQQHAPPIGHQPAQMAASIRPAYPYAITPEGTQLYSYPASLRFGMGVPGHAGYPQMQAPPPIPVTVAPLNQAGYATTAHVQPDINQRPVIPPFGIVPSSTPSATPRPKTRNPQLDPSTNLNPPTFPAQMPSASAANAHHHHGPIPQQPFPAQPMPTFQNPFATSPAQFNSAPPPRRRRRPQTPFEESPYYKPLREGESLLLTPFHPKGTQAAVQSSSNSNGDSDSDDDENLTYNRATYPRASASSRR